MGKYLVEEALFYGKIKVEPHTEHTIPKLIIPSRLVKIIDILSRKVVYQELINSNDFATHVYDQCNRMNKDYKAYDATLSEFLYLNHQLYS